MTLAPRRRAARIRSAQSAIRSALACATGAAGVIRVDKDFVRAASSFCAWKAAKPSIGSNPAARRPRFSLGAAQGGRSRSTQLTQHRKRSVDAKILGPLRRVPRRPCRQITLPRSGRQPIIAEEECDYYCQPKQHRQAPGTSSVTTAAQDLLKVFDALPAADQHEVAVAILRRASSAEDIPDAALHELADELFRGYDAEEAAHGDPPTG